MADLEVKETGMGNRTSLALSKGDSFVLARSAVRALAPVSALPAASKKVAASPSSRIPRQPVTCARVCSIQGWMKDNPPAIYSGQPLSSGGQSLCCCCRPALNALAIGHGSFTDSTQWLPRILDRKQIINPQQITTRFTSGKVNMKEKELKSKCSVMRILMATRLLALVVGMFFGVASVASAQTQVSGLIVNGTWTAANSPYQVVGNIQEIGRAHV